MEVQFLFSLALIRFLKIQKYIPSEPTYFCFKPTTTTITYKIVSQCKMISLLLFKNLTNKLFFPYLFWTMA